MLLGLPLCGLPGATVSSDTAGRVIVAGYTAPDLKAPSNDGARTGCFSLKLAGRSPGPNGTAGSESPRVNGGLSSALLFICVASESSSSGGGRLRLIETVVGAVDRLVR